MGLDAVAPLLDYQSALAAIGLPPWSRFFYRWHRGVISARCPDLASLPTADGFSASDPRLPCCATRAPTSRPSCAGSDGS